MVPERPIKPLGFALAACLVMVAGIWYTDSLTAGEHFWHSFPVCESEECFFCETPRLHNFVRQPSNTFSNIPFLFMGLYFLFVGLQDRKRKHPRNTIESDPMWSFAYGFVGIFLFLGSSLFHASLHRAMEYLDMVGVYLFAFFPVAFNLRWIIAVRKGRKRLQKTHIVLAAWLLAAFGLAIPMHALPVHGLILLSVIITAGTLIYLEWSHPGRTNRIWLVASVVSIFTAMSFFLMDVTRVFCNPFGWFQAHAFWHVMAAISGFCYFRFVRSERR